MAQLTIFEEQFDTIWNELKENGVSFLDWDCERNVDNKESADFMLPIFKRLGCFTTGDTYGKGHPKEGQVFRYRIEI